MEKTIDCRLGQLNISIQAPELGVLIARANLSTDSPSLTGFIQTQTMEYTNAPGQPYDVHRTGIKLHPFFQVDDVPLYSLGFPANLYTLLTPLDQVYAKLRVTLRTFLIEVTETGAFKFVTGFSWGYEQLATWEVLPVQELTEVDWTNALARLNYESPTYKYE